MKLLFVIAILVICTFETSRKIDESTKKLGDDDPQVRDSAQENLINLGELSLAKTKELKDSKDPEVSARAGIIEETIEKEQRTRPIRTGNIIDGIKLSLISSKKKYKMKENIELQLQIINLTNKKKTIYYTLGNFGYIESIFKGKWDQNYLSAKHGLVIFERIEFPKKQELFDPNEKQYEKSISFLPDFSLKEKESQTIKVILRGDNKEYLDENDSKKTNSSPELQLSRSYAGKFEITVCLTNNKYLPFRLANIFEPSKNNKAKEKNRKIEMIYKSYGDMVQEHNKNKIVCEKEILYSNTITIEIE